ncbi:DUF190 domain-containing protein [Sciscionella marina]|uniref:DUF190 domain-containing protein n=1 Tax=Sciscionella marina TaxID=508770 RepID=UPI00039F7A97|nr:DUF190 domain-containing protein [Sciscionella marina]
MQRVRLTIYVSDRETWHGAPLYAEIVHRAQRAGLAGATVQHGIEGFGTHRRVHTEHVFRLNDELPMVITIIDEDEPVSEFARDLEDLPLGGMMTLEHVELLEH